jgi:hypothetical protein
MSPEKTAHTQRTAELWSFGASIEAVATLEEQGLRPRIQDAWHSPQDGHCSEKILLTRNAKRSISQRSFVSQRGGPRKLRAPQSPSSF